MSAGSVVAIVNPRAAGGRTGRRATRLETQLRTIDPGIAILHTTQTGAATQLARDALRAGARHLVVAGGDGTLHEVVNGCFDEANAEPDVVLSLVPCGTGGDACDSLGVPRRVVTAVRRIREGRTRRIDLVRVRGTGPDGLPMVRHVVHVASAGLSATAAAAANRGLVTKARLGRLAYPLEGLRAAWRARPFRGTVTLDDAPPDQRSLLLCAVCNGATFGGGMRIAPDARMDDGWLEVVCVEALPRWQLLALLPTVYLGLHRRHPAVHIARARRVTLAPAHNALPVEFDGESPAIDGPLTFELLPGALCLRG